MIRSDSKQSDRLAPSNPVRCTDVLSECFRRGATDRLLAMGFSMDYLKKKPDVR